MLNGSAQTTFQEILTLIRSGALEQAEKNFRLFLLAGLPKGEDYLALEGRLLKARALETKGDDRQRLFAQSAAAYERAYKATSGTYSGINAASLLMLAGRRDQAKKMALDVREKCLQAEPSSDGLPDPVALYYHHATLGEVAFLLKDWDRAKASLEEAVRKAPFLKQAIVSTLHQFDLLAGDLGYPAPWLDEFRPASSMHYAGLTWMSGYDPKREEALRQEVKAFISSNQIGYAFGALAAGSDILIGEAALEEGVVLDIILPCATDLFVKNSVKAFGKGWFKRFERLLDQAQTVTHVTQNSDRTTSLDIDLAH